MTRDNKVSMAVGLAIITAFCLFIYGICYLVDNREQDCYEDLKATYTWNYRTDILDEVWADKRLTSHECATINSVYQDAQRIEATKKIDATIQEVKAAQKEAI